MKLPESKDVKVIGCYIGKYPQFFVNAKISTQRIRVIKLIKPTEKMEMIQTHMDAGWSFEPMICGWPKTYPELKMGRGCEGSQQIITSSSKIGNDQTEILRWLDWL